jgi:hypothetical protein
MTFPILTSHKGDNSELIPIIAEMYFKDGQTIADVTYGKGVFWKNIDRSKYTLLLSDLQDGIDFTDLPYDDKSIDVLILDPPYIHGGETVKASINDCYKNKNSSHEAVTRLYGGGILEATRVLKKHGKILIKVQDEIESGKQRFTHVECLTMLELFGFKVLDIFVLTQKGIPAMREKFQKSARKNHSYAIISEFRK